jgi:chemotaxis signal transduction protein/nucleoid-associated protein YgaU
MAQAPSHQALLLIRVGPIFCCAGTAPVTAIIEPRPLTHPPGSTAAAPGIFKHAGRIVRCRDLRYLFGVVPAATITPQRLVITDLPGGPVGFYVDEIIEVMAMPATGFGPLPALIPRGVFTRTLLLDHRIYLSADFAALATLQGSGYLRSYLAHLQTQSPAPVPPPAPLTLQAPPLRQTIPVSETPPPAHSTPRPPATPASAPLAVNKTAPPDVKRTAAAVTHSTPPVVRHTPQHRPTAIVRPEPTPQKNMPATTSYSAMTVGQVAIPISFHTTPAAPAPPSRLPAVMLILLLLGGMAGMIEWLMTPTSTQPSAATLPLTAAAPSATQTTAPVIATPPTFAPPASPLPTIVADAAVPPPHYQASIARDNEGITIELDAPPEEPVFVAAMPPDSAIPATAFAQAAPAIPSASSPAQAEIIHIVVTGDTLWHIAKRHVHDPYRYPELARLSQIANPDLIYPGNRVRIIKKHRK